MSVAEPSRTFICKREKGTLLQEQHVLWFSDDSKHICLHVCNEKDQGCCGFPLVYLLQSGI